MDRCSKSGENSQRREESQGKESVERISREKVTKHSVFPMFCGCGRSKSKFAKLAGAEPCGGMNDQNCTKEDLDVKKLKTLQSRTSFILQVAARGCGAKGIFKLKC